MSDLGIESARLLGHSPFTLTLDAQKRVLKAARPEHSDRLFQQCLKQKEFRVDHPRFSVCEVLDERFEDGKFTFTMPHHRCDVATQFIDKVRPENVHLFASDLADLIDEFISRSPMTEVPAEIIVKKSRDVAARIRARGIFQLDDLLNWHEGVIMRRASYKIPVGVCHGDLSFSNVLFEGAERRYILIDFLDAYLDSPLLDIAKVLQETRLRWSSLASGQTHDVAKYAIAMDLLDALFIKRFHAYPFYAPNIPIFEFQNLIRLLPYASDPRVIDAVTARLEEIARQSSD